MVDSIHPTPKPRKRDRPERLALPLPVAKEAHLADARYAAQRVDNIDVREPTTRS
jgi:hypothetical protein